MDRDEILRALHNASSPSEEKFLIEMLRQYDQRQSMAQPYAWSLLTSRPMPNPYSSPARNAKSSINNSTNNKTMDNKYQIVTSELTTGQVIYLEHPYSWHGRRRFEVGATSRDQAVGRLFSDEDGSSCVSNSHTIERKSSGGWYANCSGDGQAIMLIVEVGKEKVGMDSVILAQDKKDQILAAISQKDLHTKIFTQWGFGEVFEKGVAITLLFFGVPGTGKTLMAQAIADQLKMKLDVIGTADIETSEPGGAERNIKMLFKKNMGGKNIICFDECDSLLSSREEVGVIMAAQINCLLTEIERFDGVVIFTTNRLGKLDPALERRITAKVEFEFPDKIQRLAIWKRMIPTKAPLEKDVDLEKLAEFPMAGGNIKNAVLNAARQAAYQGLEFITMDNFKGACEKEIESVNAFVSAYENGIHTRNLGNNTQGMTRERGKLSLTKAQKTEVVKDIKKIKTKVEKMEKINSSKKEAK